MALSQLASTTISRGIGAAKTLLEQVKPILDGIDVLYNSANGLSTTITQADLDAASNLSNLTKGQLDDAIFALVTIKNQMQNSFAQLEELACRG